MNENEKKNKPKLPNLEYRFIFVNSGPRQLKRTWKRDFTREGFRFFSKKQFIEIKLKIQDYAVDTATLKVNHVFESLKEETLEQPLIVIGILHCIELEKNTFLSKS